MARLWEYEGRARRLTRLTRDFAGRAQESGFHEQVRGILLERGLDPGTIPALSLPAVAGKPIERSTVREVVPEPQVRSTVEALKPKPPISKNRGPSDRFIRRYLAEHFPGREDEVDVKYVPGEGTFFTYKGVPRLVPESSLTIEELHGRTVAEDVDIYGPDALPEDSPLRPGGGLSLIHI